MRDKVLNVFQKTATLGLFGLTCGTVVLFIIL
jgi:hypothetical protein